MFGEPFVTFDDLSSFLMLGLFVVLAASKHKAVHQAAVPIIVAVMILDIMVFRPVL